jgi:hypothetical protein
MWSCGIGATCQRDYRTYGRGTYHSNYGLLLRNVFIGLWLTTVMLPPFHAVTAQAGVAAPMDRYALAILKDPEIWEWPIAQRIQDSGKQGGKYKPETLTPKLLYHLIVESQTLGGTVVDQFWSKVEQCHPVLKRNGELGLLGFVFVPLPLFCAVDKFRVTPDIVSPEKSLFEGVKREEIDFTPLFKMAAEYFTHLGVACTEPSFLSASPY